MHTLNGVKMRKPVVIGLIVIFLFVALFPFESTVVPAWTITVVDETGVPYAGQRVVENWRHYSLEFDDNGEERWTDANGRVEFPRRTIRVSLLGRVVRTTLTSIFGLMHGSTGIAAYLFISGPSESKTIDYDPDKPLPDRVVLPRFTESDMSSSSHDD